jgi:AraC family transcriptional regulator
MSKALDALISSHKSITEIALQSGYQTPAAFSKAFKQLFRTTPSQVRKTGQRPGMLFNPLEIVPEIRRIKMQAEIRELPAKKVLTVTRKGLIDNNFNKTAHDAFTVLTRFISSNRIWSSLEEGCLGICPDDGVQVPPEESRYIAGYFLKDGAQVWARGEVEEMELTEGRVAVFIPTSGEQLRGAIPYEVYVNEKGKVTNEELITEIYIPIK